MRRSKPGSAGPRGDRPAYTFLTAGPQPAAGTGGTSCTMASPVRLTILVPAVAGVLAAACGGTSTASTAQSRSTPAPRSSARAGFAGGAVGGQLTQLSGGKLVINGQAGSVDVTYDSSTRLLRTLPSSMAEAAVGTCVNATGQKDASGAVTAATVNLMFNMNGTCSQPNASGAGGPGGGGQGRFGGGGAPANLAFVRGKIISVSGVGLTVQDASGATVPVDVPGTARITKTEPATASQLAVGQCIQASGQRDASGSITARQLDIVPAGPAGCPSGGAGGRPGRGGTPTPQIG